VLNEAYDSGFTMALMAKDVRLAEALGDLGPLGAATVGLVQAALAAHGPGADFNRLVDQGRAGR
jgi:3-hydroxyisobutyrate dehydrogenase